VWWDGVFAGVFGVFWVLRDGNLWWSCGGMLGEGGQEAVVFLGLKFSHFFEIYFFGFAMGIGHTPGAKAPSILGGVGGPRTLAYLDASATTTATASAKSRSFDFAQDDTSGVGCRKAVRA
jgi:hypothetical protein